MTEPAEQPAKPVRTWRPMAARAVAWALLVSCLGCHTRASRLDQPAEVVNAFCSLLKAGKPGQAAQLLVAFPQTGEDREAEQKDLAETSRDMASGKWACMIQRSKEDGDCAAVLVKPTVWDPATQHGDAFTFYLVRQDGRWMLMTASYGYYEKHLAKDQLERFARLEQWASSEPAKDDPPPQRPAPVQ